MIWRTAVLIGAGWVIGFATAHDVVARECERLGAFYVGRAVFECSVRVGRE